MWFYDRQGERAGPVQPEEMRGLVQGGQVSPATLVWREGFAGWTPAAQTELGGLFGAPPPALPPALTPVQPVAISPAAAPTGGPVQGWGAPVQAYPVQPYAPPYGPVPGVHFAGFWIRLVAYLIDVVILLIPTVLVSLAGVGMVSASPDGDGSAAVVIGVIASLAQFVIMLGGIAYFVFFASGSWHATPGKRLLGLQIIPSRGGEVDFGQAIGRFFATYLSSLILGIGFLMIGWTAQKRGLHDMIAETRVIYRRR